MLTFYLILGFLVYCAGVYGVAQLLRSQLHKLAVAGDASHQALVIYAIYNITIVIFVLIALLLNHAFSI